MLKFVKKDDVLNFDYSFSLPEFKSDEIVKLVKVFESEEQIKNEFRKVPFQVPSGTGLAIIYDNQIMDYTDYPGRYLWLGTETKIQSHKFARLLLIDISEFEGRINNLLDKNKFYIYEINLNNLHSFPLYIDDPVPFKDTKYGDIRIRTYCSIDAMITNPFISLFQIIQGNKEVITGNDLFSGKEDEIKQVFYESLNELTLHKAYSFENPEAIEFAIQGILTPKLFRLLYKSYGIHANHINIDSILPDSFSRDHINQIDKNSRRDV